jgi:hypothetical protein
MSKHDDKSAPVGMGREPKNHVIKCWTGYFDAVRAGRKTFEVRKDDRDYQEGDAVTLLDFDPATEQLTGRQEVRRIGYLARAGLIPGGYCVFALLAAPPAQPVTGCGKRMGGGMAPLKCGERTELRTVLCIDCLPAQPVREQGEAGRAPKGWLDVHPELAAAGKRLAERIAPQPSPTAGPGPFFKCKDPKLGMGCHEYQLGRPDCTMTGACKYDAPPPSTGEPAIGGLEDALRCGRIWAESGSPHLSVPEHSAAVLARELDRLRAAAPPRKTPGELAREWLAWIDGAMTNSDAIAFLERAITADRGGR